MAHWLWYVLIKNTLKHTSSFPTSAASQDRPGERVATATTFHSPPPRVDVRFFPPQPWFTLPGIGPSAVVPDAPTTRSSYTLLLFPRLSRPVRSYLLVFPPTLLLPRPRHLLFLRHLPRAIFARRPSVSLCRRLPLSRSSDCPLTLPFCWASKRWRRIGNVE